MARSVGAIELTVNANTGRMTAQLRADAKKAGKLAKRDIEKELRDLDATIDFHTEEAKDQARLLRKQIEAQLAGVPLDLDFSEARRELRAFEQQAEALELVLNTRVELSEQDLAEIQADYGAWKQQVEADKLAVQFAADMAGLLTEVEAAHAAAQRELDEIEVQFDIDMQAALADAVAEADIAKAQMEREAIRFDIDVATALAQAEGELELFLLRERFVQLGVDVDTAAALAQLELLERQNRDLHLQAHAEVEWDRAQIAADALAMQELADTLIGDFDANVNLRVAKAPKAKADALIKANMKATGRQAGESLGDQMGLGFLDVFSGRMKAIIGAVVVLAEPAAVALEGLLSATTAVASSAVSGIGAAGIALTPMIAGLAGSVTAVAVGLNGIPDALGAVTEGYQKALAEGEEFSLQTEEIQEAMVGLSPAAEDFVRAFAGIQPVLADLKAAVQESLVDGLGDELRELRSTVLPDVQEGLVLLADDVNQFFKDLSNVVQDMDLEGIFEDLSPIVQELLDAVIHLAEALEPLLSAAAPAATRLAESFSDAAESLADMISAGDESGNLAQFLDEGIDSLEVWWDLIRNVGDALFTIFEAGKSTGDGFIQTLADIVDEWDDWLESVEGQNALADFFEVGKEVMSDLVPILKGLQGFFDNLITPGAIDRFGQLADNLGDVLPFLGDLLEIVGRVGILQHFAELLSLVAEALEPVVPAAQELADVISEGLGDAIEALAPALPELADALKDLIAAITPLIEVGLEIFVDNLDNMVPLLILAADAVGVFADVLAPLVRVISPVISQLSDMVNVLDNVIGLINRIPFLGRLIPDVGLDEGAKGALEDAITVAAQGGDAAEQAGVQWETFAAQLDLARVAIELANAANESHASSTQLVGEAIAASMVEIEERNAALEEERAKAYDAFIAERELAKETENQAIAAAGALGFNEDLAEAFVDVGDRARSAAADAEAFVDVMEMILAPQKSVMEAAIGMEEAIDAAAEALTGGTEAARLRERADEKLIGLTKNNAEARRQEAEALRAEADALEAAAKTLDIGSEKGRENTQILFDMAEAAFAAAEGQLATGTATDHVVATMTLNREKLVQTAEAFGLSREAAEEYAEVLLGTPEFVETVIRQPGLIDALLNAEELHLVYDAAGEPVITEFEQLGIDPAITQSEEFLSLLETLGVTIVKPEIDPQVGEGLPAAQEAVADLDTATAEPDITMPPTAQEQLDALQSGITTLGGTHVEPMITIPFIDTNIKRVQTLDAAIDALPTSKTIRINVNTGNGFGVFQGQGLFGSMAGEIITGPTIRRVGERGYREAIVPLDLPLSRVAPSVRMLAALLRGEAGPVAALQPVGPRTVVNQSFQLTSADPRAVAVQALNRAAASAVG